jgi:hypothetical protein
MKLVALVLVTTLGVAGTAHADRPQPTARGEVRQILLEHFDRDHDGRLQPQERRRAVRALRMLARRLAMQDHARAPGGPRGVIGRFDADRDGVIRPGEMPPRMFQRFDADRDGVVHPGELAQRRADKLRRLDRDGDGAIGPGEMPLRRAHKLRRLDRDGDGAIGPGEMPLGRAHKLRRLDRDGDGAIDPDEMPQGRTRTHRPIDGDAAPDGSDQP